MLPSGPPLQRILRREGRVQRPSSSITLRPWSIVALRRRRRRRGQSLGAGRGLAAPSLAGLAGQGTWGVTQDGVTSCGRRRSRPGWRADLFHRARPGGSAGGIADRGDAQRRARNTSRLQPWSGALLTARGRLLGVTPNWAQSKRVLPGGDTPVAGGRWTLKMLIYIYIYITCVATCKNIIFL